jgi:probable addiction module antidote protein
MAPHTETYDVADYLDSDEMISAYLTEALEGNDPRDIAQALGDVARARGGLAQLAQDTGISIESLGRVLGNAGEPDFEIILKVMHALGVRLSASLAA